MSGFITRLRLDYIDGHVWEVVEPFEYCLGEPDGPERVIVPSGFLTDFASIPRPLWGWLPPTGKYGKAAVIHDALYQNRTVWCRATPVSLGIVMAYGGTIGYVAQSRFVERGEADAILNEGMKVLKVSRFVRWIVYSGVRVGGHWAWEKYRKEERVVAEPSKNVFDNCKFVDIGNDNSISLVSGGKEPKP
jgi:hypothetical protein